MKRLLAFVFGVFFIQMLSAQTCQLEKDILSANIYGSVSDSMSETELWNLNRLSFLYLKLGDVDKADSLNRLIFKSITPLSSSTCSLIPGVLDVRGHIYFALNDIENAKHIWKYSLSLKKRFFPHKTGWFAESYSNIARCYNYMIEIDSALFYSEKAVALLNQCSKAERLTINAPEILRTYIYAYKIFFRPEKEKEVGLKVISMLDSVSKIPHPWLQYYLPDYVHDKANVFTDMALQFRNEETNALRDSVFSVYCYHKAIRFYDEELALRALYNDNPNTISTLYFTKALVQTFTFRNTVVNNLKSLAYANEAISALNLTCRNGSFNDFFYNTGKLNVMLFKSQFLINLYQEEPKQMYLDELYFNAHYAYEIFISIINEKKFRNIGSIFGVYNLFQFDALIFAELELYKKTRDIKYLQDAFYHSQLSRYLDLLTDTRQRRAIDLNETSFKELLNRNVLFTQHSNHVFLDYYSSYYNPCVIFIVSDGKLRYYNGSRPDFSSLAILSDPEYVNSNTDTVYKTLHTFYNALILPVENHLAGKTNIHISSKTEFSAVPFDALIADLKNPNHFFGDDYCIQNRYSLLINPLFETQTESVPVSLFTLNPKYQAMPDLLFNQDLCDELKENYDAETIQKIRDLGTENPYILHVSAHGYFDSTIMKPALLMNDSEIVTNNEIENMPSSPLLACLIMCESGRGVIKLYEGSDNLGRSFAANGTPAVITSLWKADDKASAFIMSSFYRFLSEGLPVHEALSAAKRYFREKNPDMIHPFYWANLQCTGDNITISLQSVKQTNNRLIYSLMAGSVVFLGVLFFLFIKRRKNR